MSNILIKYIGPKEFYTRTFRVAFPLALQMLLQSSMGIIDSMMVSQIGMVTAVGNATQVLTLNDGIQWGIVSGIAMFAAQFFGAKQDNNLKRTFGLSVALSIINSVFWIAIAFLFGKWILNFYLPDPVVCGYSWEYLKVAVVAILPGAVSFSFSSMYRSLHNTKLTLIVSTLSSAANVLFNFYFLFILKTGVVGAAIGTLLAQTLSLLIFAIHAIKTKQPFIGKVSEVFHLNKEFVMPILDKMFSLMVNETLFGFGMTLFVKAFGALGTQSMDGYYVANQIFSLFLFAVHGYGMASSILIGTRLGEGRIELAKEESGYQLGLGLVLSIVIVAFMIVLSKPMLSLYGITDPYTYQITLQMIYVFSIKVFLRMFNFMMFSTLRAGGDTKILNILDSGILYFVGLPLAFGSVYILKLDSIVSVLLICQIEQVVRLFITLKRYNSGIWATDITQLVSE